MLISQRNKPRCREFTGPTPHSVAVRARAPSSRPPDHLILERRRQEAARDKSLEFTKYQKTCDLKTHWEKNTDQRIVLGTIKRRVDNAMERYQLDVDERREKLQALLEAEEEALLKEMETRTETMPERQAKMRERAKLLRERRESDRQLVVAQKLEQQFRDRSEELRSVQSKRIQDEVCAERAAQLTMREEAWRQQEEEERLFAELWEGDRLAKEERESRDAEKQRRMNLQQVEYLRVQMEAVEQQRGQARQLKEEEAQLLLEQREVLRLEEQRERSQKLQGQESRRRLLDHSLRLKMKRLAREQQDELALDMSILEQLLAEARDEKQGDVMRKLELREEQSRYRQYLADQLNEQKTQEAQIEQVIEADLKQTLARRAEQSRLVREARDRLMKDVMETRRLQIQEKLDLNMQKQAQLAQERNELNKSIEEDKMLDKEQKQRLKQESQDHQADLLAQMMHQQQLRDKEEAEAEREYQRGLVDQEHYNNKIQDILSGPTSLSRPVHPFRRTQSSTSRSGRI
ncbi:cilia- and flagella-associated protein 53 [Osmerus eperlanus]|uniref:cilia- and flagella-associated protein 53 n=1 Tax=Osmerus eperlanus TaxID=29151 RepID=UPI002E13ADA6